MGLISDIVPFSPSSLLWGCLLGVVLCPHWQTLCPPVLWPCWPTLCPPLVLILSSSRSPFVLLLSSSCPPVVLLSSSCPPLVRLLSFSSLCEKARAHAQALCGGRWESASFCYLIPLPFVVVVVVHVRFALGIQQML